MTSALLISTFAFDKQNSFLRAMLLLDKTAFVCQGCTYYKVDGACTYNLEITPKASHH